MESKVIFRTAQEIVTDDFNDVQDYARQSFDHLVADAITPGRGYAGFLAAITGAAKITAEPGRLYAQGRVYVRAASIDFDFTTALPVAGKKNVLLVVAPQDDVQDQQEPRAFLVDEATGASETQVVSTRSARIASINAVAGQPGPDPVDPVVDAAYLPVARVVLQPTGVLSVDMLLANRLESVDSLDARLGALEDSTDADRAKIVALDSNIASLTERVTGTVNQDAFGRALVRLADLEAKQGVPSTAVGSATDYFLTDAQSALTDASSSCMLMEGIRFPDEAASVGALQLSNPLNPLAKVVSDVLYPAYDRVARMTVGPRQGEVQASAYTYQSNDLVQLTRSRSRVRYGDIFTVCTNAGWWGTIKEQYIPQTFAHNGELFQNLGVTWDGPTHGWVRVQEYWVDTWEETYWATQTVNHAIPGSQVAETFLIANDMVLDAIGLTFTRLDANGSVTVAICETDRGQPDPTRVIAISTVPRAQLLVNTETVIGFEPTYLTGGKRYAVVIITPGNHYLATTQGINFPQGTLFYILDGAYQQGDATRDICFTLYAAKFRQARSVIELGALQLVGGIAAIDILADAISPGSTSLDYEVLVGGTWYPLAQGPSFLTAGGAIPPLLPLRAVMTGTPDVQPSVKLTNAVVRVSRSKLAFTHISATMTTASTTQVRVMEKLENFDGAHHSATCKLLTGAGFATVAAANSYSDQVGSDGSYVIRTWVFNLGAAVTAYRIRSEGTTDAVARPWHVGWRKCWSL